MTGRSRWTCAASVLLLASAMLHMDAIAASRTPSTGRRLQAPNQQDLAEAFKSNMADLKYASNANNAVFQAAALQVKDPNYTSPFPTVTGAAGTPISSSVSVFYHEDWDVTYVDNGLDWTSRCVDMVYKAADSKSSVVNFVITHYWIDEDFDGVVDAYCSKTNWGNGCQKMNPLAIDRFRFGMQWCFQKAVQMNMSIAITPHLDDGLELGGWRNALSFDPLAKYAGYSYWDIMLKPLAQAINAVVTPTTQVWFAMQGEMSATVVRFPASYTKLIPKIKAAIVEGRDDAAQILPNTLVGVSTNFNKICACVLMDLIDPTEYLIKLPAAMKTVINQFNITAIKELYDTVDLIGISSYAGLKANFKQADLEDAIMQFDTEIKEFGVDLKDLIHNKGKMFVLSEYGVGGGIAQNGAVPARTQAEAGMYPFFGIWGVYNEDTDPWKTWEADSVDVPTRTWRRMFYKQTSRWLVGNGGPTYRVDGLFLWNLASWDVQAIHYASYDNKGNSYRDWVVAERIKAHNMFVSSQYKH